MAEGKLVLFRIILNKKGDSDKIMQKMRYE